MESVSSSFLHPDQGQHAGAHSGLIHPAGGPLSPAPTATSGEVAGEATEGDRTSASDGRSAPPEPLRSVCAWCIKEGRETVLVEGPTDDQGRSSHGICKEHAAKMTSRVSAAIVGPLVARPVPGLGRYEIVDQKGRRIAHPLFSLNAAAAVAHILNQGLERDGICLLHLQVKRIDRTCFSCEHGFAASPYAVAR